MADQRAAPNQPRSFWKGYLKLSLVTCRVAMLPVKSDSDKIRFHTLNRRTGNRIRSRFVDAETGAIVADADEVRGYPRDGKPDIMLEEDELAAVALESTRTIDIRTFVPDAAIDPVWYDTPHYLVPDDEIGTEAFCVIRAAMDADHAVGISRLVLYRRERAVLLKPLGKGIVLWTLRFGDEVRDADAYFRDAPPTAHDPDLIAMMSDVIDARTKPWSRDMVTDPVQDRLVDLIKAKQHVSRAKARPRKAAPESNVIDLRDALMRSLAGRRR